MKNYLVGVFLLVSFFNFSSAQMTGDIDPNGSTISMVCTALSNNLRIGSRDRYTNGEVTNLQEFLISQNVFDVDPTGYFGPVTFRAVQAFQSANGILN